MSQSTTKYRDIEQPDINESGIVIMPPELEGAPEEVQKSYVEWAKMKEYNRTNPRRYFDFINQVTNELETVDAMMFRGQPERYAIKRNISKEDLEELKIRTLEMEKRKKTQMSIKNGWWRWAKKQGGRDVYEWRKAEMIDWYARFFSHEEVKEKLEKMGYYIDINSLYKFFLRQKDVIDKARVEFIRSSSDHYIASEAGRMEVLAMLHYKFMKKFDDEYVKNKNDNKELRMLSQEIRQILEQARKELKGEEVRLTVDGKIDINASILASRTIQEVSRKIPINLIVVYLVAAKRGIQPHSILTSLVTSFYKDYNGFSRVMSGQPKTTIDIIRSYDWNEIKDYQANKNIAEEEIPLTMYEEVPFIQESKAVSGREKLKNLLAKTRDDLSKE